MLGHKGSDYSVAFSVEVSIAVHRIQIQLTPASMIQRAEHSHICSLNQRDAKRGSYFHLLTSGEDIFRREFRPKYAWPMAMGQVTEDSKKRAISCSDGVEKRQNVKKLIITFIS